MSEFSLMNPVSVVYLQNLKDDVSRREKNHICFDNL